MAENLSVANCAAEHPPPEMRKPRSNRGFEHDCEVVITPDDEYRRWESNPHIREGYGILNPASGCCNTNAEQDVASDGSFAGPSTGPKSGELVTTNENVERVAASSERGQEHDAELARIVAAWSELPAVLKGAMLAMVDSAGAGSGR